MKCKNTEALTMIVEMIRTEMKNERIVTLNAREKKIQRNTQTTWRISQLLVSAATDRKWHLLFRCRTGSSKCFGRRQFHPLCIHEVRASSVTPESFLSWLSFQRVFLVVQRNAWKTSYTGPLAAAFNILFPVHDKPYQPRLSNQCGVKGVTVKSYVT